MKIAKCNVQDEDRFALVENGGLARLLPPLAAGEALDLDTLSRWADIDPATLEQVEGVLEALAPVGRVGKFIGIGLNYRDHAIEAGLEIPREPVIFQKTPSAIAGPFDEIVLPPGSTKTDWEVELGIVIGAAARHVSEAEAVAAIAGYLVVNDISEREYQLERGGTWDKGKVYDKFGPLGPWLVTRDEVPDPQALELWLELNGEERQRSSTSQMIFSCAEIVSYLSRFMTLLPGDVITTGTPPGVGMGMKPPRYLRDGDIMRLGVEGLGEQELRVRE